jgi:hypothetical protein
MHNQAVSACGEVAKHLTTTGCLAADKVFPSEMEHCVGIAKGHCYRNFEAGAAM